MKKKLSNKLCLKKETLSTLNKIEMNVLRGGYQTEGAWCTDTAPCSYGCIPPTGATLCPCQ